MNAKEYEEYDEMVGRKLEELMGKREEEQSRKIQKYREKIIEVKENYPRFIPGEYTYPHNEGITYVKVFENCITLKNDYFVKAKRYKIIRWEECICEWIKIDGERLYPYMLVAV